MNKLEIFRPLFQAWVGADPTAVRLASKRAVANTNRRRRGLSARRKNYWGSMARKHEQRVMALFHLHLNNK